MLKGRKFNFSRLINISRPITWFFYPFIFYLGVRFSGGSLDLYQIILMSLMSFPMGLIGYGMNDIYDYETDRINPRKGGIQGSKIKKSEIKNLKKIIYPILILFYFYILLSGKLDFILTMFTFGLICYLYIAPPFRLKGKPIIDLISGGMILILLPFAAGFSYQGDLMQMPWKIYGMTLYAMGMQAIHMVVDMKYDKKSGDKTTPVVFGIVPTLVFSSIVFLGLFLFGNFSPYIKYLIGATGFGNILIILFPRIEYMKKFGPYYFLITILLGIIYAIVYFI